jgi:DNA-binding CsgD family transcriptional regulator
MQVLADPIKSSTVPVADLVRALSADILDTLDPIRVPAFIVDSQRRLRWQNAASIELLGDLRGRLDSSIGLDSKDLECVRAAYVRKVNGATHSEVEVSLPRPNGTPVRLALSSVPLRDPDGVLIGTFGVAQVIGELESAAAKVGPLSPREHETLTLLAEGHSTATMAERMGIAKETVRNHVKRVLRALDARSRVEAVAKARRIGLI